MDEELLFLGLAALLLLATVIALPIWALVRTRRITQLEQRVQGLEAALLRVMRDGAAPAASAPEPALAPTPTVNSEQPTAEPEPVPATAAHPPEPRLPTVEPGPPAKKLEELIGERWLGWTGISILLFGAAFFLKLAFDNRWIGELGRVSIGLLAGLGFVYFGWRRHQTGWRTFSQIFTAGGVTLMYLSIYASYGFYDLIPIAAAFGFLALIVVQAHLLAVAYNAPAIALMGQIGGFLAPVLLSTGKDNYTVLFTYAALLNLGAVLVAIRRDWRWVGFVSYWFSQILFWGWHESHYHPEKVWPAVAFQAALFGLFVFADFEAMRRRGDLTWENWLRVFLNPVLFFSIAHSLLEPEYPEWMGVFAIVTATLFAAVGKWSLSWTARNRRPTLIAVALSLLFVTVAIPIQLEANWVTLAWGLQAVLLAWLALRLEMDGLRYAALFVASLALIRFVLADTPWDYRATFTLIFNSYFLGALALAACLAAVARQIQTAWRRAALTVALLSIGVVWLAMTVEAYSYFDSIAATYSAAVDWDRKRSLEWTGQMTVSVLWACFASALVWSGLKRGIAALRWTGLALFGVTVVKALIVDILILEGAYRIVALMALGALLLGVGWGYQRISKAASASGETA